jgi:hypothetical protein
MVNKGTWEFVGYICLAGLLIGYYHFREPFMDWLWTFTIPVVTLFGAPIVAAGVLYLVLLFVVLRWVVGVLQRFFAA